MGTTRRRWQVPTETDTLDKNRQSPIWLSRVIEASRHFNSLGLIDIYVSVIYTIVGLDNCCHLFGLKQFSDHLVGVVIGPGTVSTRPRAGFEPIIKVTYVRSSGTGPDLASAIWDNPRQRDRLFISSGYESYLSGLGIGYWTNLKQ